MLCAWSTIAHPDVAGALATVPQVDAVAMDLQHGAYDYAAAAAAIRVIGNNAKPAVVRIPVGEFTTASRLLDAGASAIIAPMINSPEDAQAFVRFVKYAPLGARSWGPTAAMALGRLEPQAYLGGANAGTCAFAMIETREALDRIDAILAVPGIDGVFIGPADLSITLSGGTLAPASPEVDAAIDLALKRTRAAGKIPAIFAPTAERARTFISLGYAFVVVGNDAPMLRQGAGEMVKKALAPG